MTVNGQPSFGIGLHLNVGPNVTIGTMGAIPYLIITFDVASNLKELKKSGFDLSGYEKQGVSLIANVSTVGWGIGISFKDSKVEGMQEKEAQLARVLEKMKRITTVAELDAIVLGEGLAPEQERLVKEDMIAYLKTIGFDAMRDDMKKFALADYANRRIALFREIQGKLLEKQGTMHSETFFGIQFIAGFFPLPMFGAAFESVNVSYRDDKNTYLDDKFARTGVKTVDEGLKQMEAWLPD